MEYTPQEILQQRVKEMPIKQATDTGRPAGIFRGLRASSASFEGDHLVITTDSLPFPLKVQRNSLMMFGDETITALDYATRVIERDDEIDAVLLPPTDGYFPMSYYWIRIVYVDQPLNPNTYSKKDDGLFAMRAKSGEKAERRVARYLRDNGGHIYPAELRESPGYFEIRYAGKKKRDPNRPDRRCTVCGLSLEIKKRNKDRRFRVSHSAQRPFTAENAADGWHAFVFPDMSMRFIANETIANAIEKGQCQIGRDRYDSWAELMPDAAETGTPPACTVIF